MPAKSSECQHWCGSPGVARRRREAVGLRLLRSACVANSGTVNAAAPVTGDFETWWRKCVHDGFIPNSALPVKTFSLKPEGQAAGNAGGTPAVPVNASAVPSGSGGYELVFRTDPSIFDGQFANNGWLQELPKPLTKITWENVAHVSHKTASDLRLKNGAGKAASITYRDQYHVWRSLSMVCPWIQRTRME